MRVLLMHRDKDFELYGSPSTNRYARRQEPDRDTLLRAIVWNAPALTQDLELNTLLRAMAGGDEFLFTVAQQAILSGLRNDSEHRPLPAGDLEGLREKSGRGHGTLQSHGRSDGRNEAAVVGPLE